MLSRIIGIVIALVSLFLYIWHLAKQAGSRTLSRRCWRGLFFCLASGSRFRGGREKGNEEGAITLR